jgi:hypothetical protein
LLRKHGLEKVLAPSIWLYEPDSPSESKGVPKRVFKSSSSLCNGLPGKESASQRAVVSSDSLSKMNHPSINCVPLASMSVIDELPAAMSAEVLKWSNTRNQSYAPMAVQAAVSFGIENSL